MTAKVQSWEMSFAKFSLFREVSIVLFTSFAIGLFSKAAVILPFTPVPITTQMNVILLFSMFLGPRRAAAAVFAFLAQGAIGMPVFAGGVGGAAWFFGPRGGYLIGYLIAAALTGYLSEKIKERSSIKAFGAMVAGNCAVYVVGAAYLSLFVGPMKALALGVAPFILGDLFKLLIGTKVLSAFGWFDKNR